MILTYQGKHPRIDPSAFIAANATIVGDVVIHAHASVWFGAVIRADKGQIVIGRGANVQDNAVIHLTHSPALDTVIGAHVTIGHGAVLEGCIIDDGALIGMNAVVLPGAHIGARAVVAAGAVVTENTTVAPETLVAGAPARVKKTIAGRSLDQVTNAPRNYLQLKDTYPQEARMTPHPHSPHDGSAGGGNPVDPDDLVDASIDDDDDSVSMKTLLLLRHAKSSWKESHLDDHARPLNKRGRADAPRMGALLDRENLLPDLIITSDAVRAEATAQLVAHACDYDGELDVTPELYHASPEAMIDLLQFLPDDYQRVMLVGHNPGLETLIEVLTDESPTFTTANLAHIALPIRTWSQITVDTAGILLHLWRPKELDPEPEPDATDGDVEADDIEETNT